MSTELPHGTAAIVPSAEAGENMRARAIVVLTWVGVVFTAFAVVLCLVRQDAPRIADRTRGQAERDKASVAIGGSDWVESLVDSSRVVFVDSGREGSLAKDIQEGRPPIKVLLDVPLLGRLSPDEAAEFSRELQESHAAALEAVWAVQHRLETGAASGLQGFRQFLDAMTNVEGIAAAIAEFEGGSYATADADVALRRLPLPEGYTSFCKTARVQVDGVRKNVCVIIPLSYGKYESLTKYRAEARATRLAELEEIAGALNEMSVQDRQARIERHMAASKRMSDLIRKRDKAALAAARGDLLQGPFQIDQVHWTIRPPK